MCPKTGHTVEQLAVTSSPTPSSVSCCVSSGPDERVRKESYGFPEKGPKDLLLNHNVPLTTE